MIIKRKYYSWISEFQIGKKVKVFFTVGIKDRFDIRTIESSPRILKKSVESHFLVTFRSNLTNFSSEGSIAGFNHKKRKFILLKEYFEFI